MAKMSVHSRHREVVIVVWEVVKLREKLAWFAARSSYRPAYRKPQLGECDSATPTI